MMDDAQQRIEEWKERVLGEALTLVADTEALTCERGMAAEVATSILEQLEWTEARATAVMKALASCVDGPAEPYVVAVALLDIIQQNEGRRPAKVAAGLARLAERAHAQGFRMIQHAFLTVMIQNKTWSRIVRPEWVEAVVRYAAVRPVIHGVLDPAGEILHLWLPRHGVDHDWLRAVVRECPRLLDSHWLDLSTRRRLFLLAPTAEGWGRLAEFDDPPPPAPWRIEALASDLPQALETLEAARVAAEADGKGARAIIFGMWLAQLQSAP
jgi:hypothetical protein